MSHRIKSALPQLNLNFVIRTEKIVVEAKDLPNNPVLPAAGAAPNAVPNAGAALVTAVPNVLPNAGAEVVATAPKVLPNAGAAAAVVATAPKVLPKAGAAAVVAAAAPKLLPNVGATAAVGWPNVLAPNAGAGVEAAAPNVEPKVGCVVAPNVDVPKPPKPVEEVAVVVVGVPKASGVPKPIAEWKENVVLCFEI